MVQQIVTVTFENSMEFPDSFALSTVSNSHFGQLFLLIIWTANRTEL